MVCPNCGSEAFVEQERCAKCGMRGVFWTGGPGWLIPMGRWLSCPVALHKSWVLIVFGCVGCVLLLDPWNGFGLLRILAWVMLWASVVLGHEVGHMASLHVQRVACRQAILYPLPVFSIQGWGLSGSTRQRVAAALAGPVVSLVLALSTLPFAYLWRQEMPWLGFLCCAHALVGLLNFLPLEPFDGALIFSSPVPSELLEEPSSALRFVSDALPAPPPPDEFEGLDKELELLLAPELAPNVDQILEKILLSGLDSLTELERGILQEASRHLRR